MKHIEYIAVLEIQIADIRVFTTQKTYLYNNRSECFWKPLQLRLDVLQSSNCIDFPYFFHIEGKLVLNYNHKDSGS